MKKFIKDNLKRISSVILCIVLLFSFTLTTFAYDGEAPSVVITADDLREYNETAYSYFNAEPTSYGASPLFSSLNQKALDAVFTISSATSGDEVVFPNPKVYLQLSTGYLKAGSLVSYYIVPETYAENGSLWDDIVSKFNYTGWYPLFYTILSSAYSNTNSNSSTVPYFNFASITNTFRTLMSHMSNAGFDFSAVVYSVSFRKDGQLKEVSYLGHHSSLFEAVQQLGGEKSYTQVSMYADSEYSGKPVDVNLSKTPALHNPIETETENLNKFVSSSTYSLTASDYFLYDETFGGSYVSLSSLNYSFIHDEITKFQTSYGVTGHMVPDHILKEEYRSGTGKTTLSNDSSSTTYWKNSDIYLESHSFFFLHGMTGANSGMSQRLYTIDFGSETNPILYLKMLSWNSIYSPLYVQLVSKVDFKLYCNGGLVGEFDAETSSYTAIIGASYVVDFYARTSDSSSSVPYFQKDSTTKKYPSILVGEPRSNGSVKSALWTQVMGKNIVVSIFPVEIARVGFYFYISPENMPDIISGSTSSTIPGGDSDFDPFWTANFGKDYEGILGMEIPDAPDYSELLTDLNFFNIWELPDKIVEKMVETSLWISDVFKSLVETYGGITRKFFTLGGLILNILVPPYIRILFIFGICCVLIMKILQFTRSSAFELNSITSNSDKMKGSNKDIKDRKGRDE